MGVMPIDEKHQRSLSKEGLNCRKKQLHKPKRESCCLPSIHCRSCHRVFPVDPLLSTEHRNCRPCIYKRYRCMHGGSQHSGTLIKSKCVMLRMCGKQWDTGYSELLNVSSDFHIKSSSPPQVLPPFQNCP